MNGGNHSGSLSEINQREFGKYDFRWNSNWANWHTQVSDTNAPLASFSVAHKYCPRHPSLSSDVTHHRGDQSLSHASKNSHFSSIVPAGCKDPFLIKRYNPSFLFLALRSSAIIKERCFLHGHSSCNLMILIICPRFTLFLSFWVISATGFSLPVWRHRRGLVPTIWLSVARESSWTARTRSNSVPRQQD